MQTGIIEFQGKELLTAKDVESGKVYVAMKPIVQNMGLSWGRQSDKITSDVRYTQMRIPYKTTGGTQEMLSLPTDQLAGFLFSINPNKVRKDLRDRIIAYQQETFNAINDYWNKGYAQRDVGTSAPKPMSDAEAQMTQAVLSSLQNIGEVVQALGGQMERLDRRLQIYEEAERYKREKARLRSNRKATGNGIITRAYEGRRTQFIEVMQAILKRSKKQLNQSQLLIQAGYRRDDKTARKWLGEGMGIYWRAEAVQGALIYSVINLSTETAA